MVGQADRYGPGVSLDFVVTGFETVSSFHASPCNAALVRVSDGVVVSDLSLRHHQADHHEFDAWNGALDEITPAQAQSSIPGGDHGERTNHAH